MSSYGEFEDQDEYESCRIDLVSYDDAERARQSKVDAGSDARRAVENVTSQYSDAVGALNSRAN